MEKQIDKIIIGAGIYGFFAAHFYAKKGKSVVILEYDSDVASRATYINQARVHNGYHYPRSYSTAIKSLKYFKRFNKDFRFAINDKFEQIYAISSKFSWTSAEQFEKFCRCIDNKCEEINPDKYFKKGMVDGAFITQEYSFDALAIKNYYISELSKYPKIQTICNSRINSIEKEEKVYKIALENGDKLISEYVLNSTYASINQIIKKAGYDTFKIKYEICEIILCELTENIKNFGITVMDGPFFSVMPFGLTGLHSLTSVAFTPHMTSYDELPKFECQKKVNCSPKQLENCNQCLNKPSTAWNYMYTLSKKYLNSEIDLKYKKSLFSIKPILMASEIDDSRPTVIRQFSSKPTFISVLSGKINTIYDLEEVL